MLSKRKCQTPVMAWKNWNTRNRSGSRQLTITFWKNMDPSVGISLPQDSSKKISGKSDKNLFFKFVSFLTKIQDIIQSRL